MLTALEHAVASQLAEQGQAISPANLKAQIDRIRQRIENAIDANNAKVTVVKKQDRPDSDFIRLTSVQVNALMRSPKIDTLKGLRDTAIIALMLCTGLREQELCNLEVRDLRQRMDGALALHIREGKGAKERLVPYGELSWVLALVDSWLERVGITDGIVFRGFYRDGKTIRPNKLNVRSVQRILKAYPIMIDGDLKSVKPHDLRRSYARRLYDANVDLMAIRDNLGHSDSKTTQVYIGRMNGDSRKPPAIFEFDLSGLQAIS